MDDDDDTKNSTDTPVTTPDEKRQQPDVAGVGEGNVPTGQPVDEEEEKEEAGE